MFASVSREIEKACFEAKTLLCIITGGMNEDFTGSWKKANILGIIWSLKKSSALAGWHLSTARPVRSCSVTTVSDQLLQLSWVCVSLQAQHRWVSVQLAVVWIWNFFKVTLSSSLQQFSTTQLPAKKVVFFPLCSFNLTSAHLHW